jgi:hypothetical protein
MASDKPDQDPSDVTISIALEGRGSFSGTGPSSVVLEALERFRADVSLAAPRAPQPPASPEQTVEGKPEERAQKATNTFDASLPLSPFLKAKAPKSNPQAVAVIAVWDKRTNKTTEFTSDSIGALWRSSGRKAPGNLNRDIIEAARAGWLHRTSQGKYTTTLFGEEFVDGLAAAKTKD